MNARFEEKKQTLGWIDDLNVDTTSLELTLLGAKDLKK